MPDHILITVTDWQHGQLHQQSTLLICEKLLFVLRFKSVNNYNCNSFSPLIVPHKSDLSVAAWMPCSRSLNEPFPFHPPVCCCFSSQLASHWRFKAQVHSSTKTDNITPNILCQVAPAVCAACVKSATGLFPPWQPQPCSPKLASERRSHHWWKPRADNTTKRGFNFTARSARTFPEGWIVENLVVCNNVSVGRA